MDHLKLYLKDDSELKGLLRIVKEISDEIGMEFSLSECAKATFKTGRLENYDHVWLDKETMNKDLEQAKVYKYLGVDESSGIKHATMKQKLKKELVWRTRLILKTELNSNNRITIINMVAFLVINYSFNIIDWNLREVNKNRY